MANLCSHLTQTLNAKYIHLHVWIQSLKQHVSSRPSVIFTSELASVHNLLTLGCLSLHKLLNVTKVASRLHLHAQITIHEFHPLL